MTTFRLDQTEQWRSYAAGKVREAAQRGLLATAVRLVAHIQNDIIPALVRVPVARGAYRAAWRAVEVEGGAAVINTAPHAVFIEEGVRAENVRPGRKMIQALAEWVRMKGIGGTISRGGKLKKPSLTEAVSIAWAIANSMKRRGIFGQGGLGVLRQAARRAPEFAREEVAREVRRAFGGEQ